MPRELSKEEAEKLSREYREPDELANVFYTLSLREQEIKRLRKFAELVEDHELRLHVCGKWCVEKLIDEAERVLIATSPKKGQST